MRNVIRTKTYYCGQTVEGKTKYIEIDLFPYLETDKPATRKRKEKVTCPKQKKLNNKRARRYFAQLVKSNFDDGDLHVTLTYNQKHLPATTEEAEKELKNFLLRIRRKRKALGLDALKYIYVTETTKTGRVHHHIIMNGGLERDDVEKLWSKRKESMGYANADRLRADEEGLEAIAAYLSKDPKGRRRWCASRNLRKPEVSVSDTKTSKRKFYELAKCPEDCQAVKDYFESRNHDYILTRFEKYYNDEIGTWMLRAKMARRR